MGNDAEPAKQRRRGVLLAALVLCIVAAGSVYARDVLTAERAAAFESALVRLGAWGPLAYMAAMVLASLAMVPCVPLTILGGVFGLPAGVVYASASSMIGASLSFTASRYLFRHHAERWAMDRPLWKRMGDGVARSGWKTVVTTRMTPFPFGLQNYLYGLTRVRFTTFIFFTWLCTLPATTAYVLLGSAVVKNKGDVRRMLVYAGGGVACLLLLSLAPRLLRSRSSSPDQ